MPAVQALQPGKSMPVVVELLLLLLLAVVGSGGGCSALWATPPTGVLVAEKETDEEPSSVLDDRDWRRNVEAIV